MLVLAILAAGVAAVASMAITLPIASAQTPTYPGGAQPTPGGGAPTTPGGGNQTNPGGNQTTPGGSPLPPTP